MNGWKRALVAITATVFLPGAGFADFPGGYFAVIVADLDRSRAWYVSTLGLEEVSRLTDENGRYDIINLSRDGLFVELVQLRDAQARPEGRLEGPFKVGFLVADLDAFLAALPADRERPEVVEDQRNGLKMVQLRDPDGTVVQVMARQP